jgi:formyl-CoA transferase
MPLSGVFEWRPSLVLVGAFKANRCATSALRSSCRLSLDPRFANLPSSSPQGELQRQFASASHCRARPLAGPVEAQDLLCAPVRDMREVLVDPQTVHNAMVMEGGAETTGATLIAARSRCRPRRGAARVPPVSASTPTKCSPKQRPMRPGPAMSVQFEVPTMSRP